MFTLPSVVHMMHFSLVHFFSSLGHTRQVNLSQPSTQPRGPTHIHYTYTKNKCGKRNVFLEDKASRQVQFQPFFKEIKSLATSVNAFIHLSVQAGGKLTVQTF